MDTFISSKDIGAYYDSVQKFYTLFWSRTALHMGLWYDDTKNLAEAVINTDRFVADILDISPDDTVLDAGCGVGGTSIYLAENMGARVEGITLSGVQLKIASERASRSRALGLLNFSIQDFTQTSFKENTFSKVFGIESICYANKKIDFLNEAYRVMKPGGKVAVIDAFATKEDLDPEEREAYEEFCKGWLVPNISTRDQFKVFLQEAGFTNLIFHDLTHYVRKSSERAYFMGVLLRPIQFLLSKLRIKRGKFTAHYYQKVLLDKKAGVYGAFVAEKPR